MRLSRATRHMHSVILLALIVVICVGCKGSAGPDETGTPSTPDVIVSNEPRAWMALDSTRLQQGDMDKATEMCESLMRDSYAAKKKSVAVDLTQYIIDPNLLKYSEFKLKQEAYNQIITHVDISIAKEEAHDTYLYLKLAAKVYNDVGGYSGETMEFVVKNVNGRLVVADWGALGGPGGKSFFDFMHRRQWPVTNPTIWEDPAKVKTLFAEVGIQ
jgi:hypothetical protein